MILSKQNTMNWRNHLHEWCARWFEYTFPARNRSANTALQFTSYAATWHPTGEHRLCRLDFPPATRFAQNSHPALSLEELLSLRWHASTELAQMDQALLLAKQEYDAALAAHHGQAMDDCPPLEQAFLAMQDLRSARAGAVDELALLDNQIELAFMQWGVPPPTLATGPS